MLAHRAALACFIVVIGCAQAPMCFSEASAADCEIVSAMELADVLPAARGNDYADDDSAAELGFRLFFRSDLGNGVACATCHLPELDFTDRLPVSTGLDVGTRNAPTVLNSARLSV